MNLQLLNKIAILTGRKNEVIQKHLEGAMKDLMKTELDTILGYLKDERCQKMVIAGMGPMPESAIARTVTLISMFSVKLIMSFLPNNMM